MVVGTVGVVWGWKHVAGFLPLTLTPRGWHRGTTISHIKARWLQRPVREMREECQGLESPRSIGFVVVAQSCFLLLEKQAFVYRVQSTKQAARGGREEEEEEVTVVGPRFGGRYRY